MSFASAYPTDRRSHPRSRSRSPAPETDLVLETIEALQTIQASRHVQVFAPDLSTLMTRQARSLVHAAQLLRGETLTARWDSYPARGKADAPLERGRSSQSSSGG